MTAATGQVLRLAGLAIEALCVLGLLSVTRGKTGFWSRLGIDPSILLAAGLAVGFIVWAFGTFTILRARSRS